MGKPKPSLAIIYELTYLVELVWNFHNSIYTKLWLEAKLDLAGPTREAVP